MYKRLTIFEEKVLVITAVGSLQKEMAAAMFYKNEERVNDLSQRLAVLHDVNARLDRQILKEYGYTHAESTIRSAIRPNVHVVKDSTTNLELIVTDPDRAE